MNSGDFSGNGGIATGNNGNGGNGGIAIGGECVLSAENSLWVFRGRPAVKSDPVTLTVS